MSEGLTLPSHICTVHCAFTLTDKTVFSVIFKRFSMSQSARFYEMLYEEPYRVEEPCRNLFFFFLMYWFSRQCVFVVLIVAGFVKAWVSFPRREMVMEKRILNIISQIWLWKEELEKFCIEPSKVCDMCGCNKSSWDPENIPVVEVRRLIKNCDPLFPDIDGGGDGQIRNPGIFSGTEELFHVWPDSWSWESTLDA